MCVLTEDGIPSTNISLGNLHQSTKLQEERPEFFILAVNTGFRDGLTNRQRAPQAERKGIVGTLTNGCHICTGCFHEGLETRRPTQKGRRNQSRLRIIITVLQNISSYGVLGNTKRFLRSENAVLPWWVNMCPSWLYVGQRQSPI